MTDLSWRRCPLLHVDMDAFYASVASGSAPTCGTCR